MQSELRSHHRTPAWATRVTISEKKKKKRATIWQLPPFPSTYKPFCYIYTLSLSKSAISPFLKIRILEDISFFFFAEDQLATLGMSILSFQSSPNGSKLKIIKKFYLGRIKDSGEQEDRNYPCRTKSLPTLKNLTQSLLGSKWQTFLSLH